MGRAELSSLAGQPLQRAAQDPSRPRRRARRSSSSSTTRSRRSQVPKDTEHVKHIRFESPLLSKFWGHPIFIGATILLPKDYDRDVGSLVPGQLRAGALLARCPGGIRRSGRTSRGRDGERKGARAAARGIHAGLARRRVSPNDLRHVPAPDALLRRLLRHRLAEQRPLRPGHHDRADPVHREALPRDPAAVGPHPLGRLDGRLGVARAADLLSRLLRRDVLLLPRPRRLPLLRDGQHLRVGQRLVPQGRMAQDADPGAARPGRSRALDDEGAAQLRARHGHQRALRRRLGLLAGRLRPGVRHADSSSRSSIPRPARSTTASRRTGRSTRI